ncbi:SMP-30/gluconolactonase/LRE family protein [SAR202 cluster bacterium AD-804-J14_MRT_500m]|nr:SMP-30/gluconolactonase/LRE family protein [SAR202 cluster bacterium AD-804-J14_MRT_500m]
MKRSLSDFLQCQEPEQLATGFQFTEGPIWHPRGWLLFSDIPADTIYRWSPTEGVEIYVRPSQNSNGLTLDKQGRLVACEHSGRRVSRMGDDPVMTTLVSKYQGLRLNSPNDLVFHSSGSLYFTDPNYGIEPGESELGFQGVFRLNIDGTLELLISDFDGPNGLVFSPDESILYVGDSRRRKTWAFEHRSDGSIREGSIFIDQDVEERGNTDGMKVDAEGNLYITGGGGIWVVEPTGRHVGTIVLPEQPANLAFGDPDGLSLYITARTSLYRMRMKIPGIRPI